MRVTVSQIRALRLEAAEAGDSRQVALCDTALQLVRDRMRGTVHWSAESPPHEIVACLDAIATEERP